MRSVPAGDPDARALRGARQERDDGGVRRREAREVLVAQARAHREALLLLGRLGRLRLDHDGAVPAHAREAGRDLVEDAVEDGRHDDEREDAEHEERQREERAQLVRPELDEPAGDDFPDRLSRAEGQTASLDGRDAAQRPGILVEVLSRRSSGGLRAHEPRRSPRARLTHSAAPPSETAGSPSTRDRARTGSRMPPRGGTPRGSSRAA